MRGEDREAYIEIAQVGASLRVAAIDAETGVEVVVIAPATASRREIEAVALGKLARALSARDAPGAAAHRRRPGVIV